MKSQPNESLHTSGQLTLVGAGPGDPDLITLAGVKALQTADVVIYDRLVSPALLEYAPQAEHIYAGKQAGHSHEHIQQCIGALIAQHAGCGQHVVRLKGGDPMIFGRGAEEIELARQHGFVLRIIPGITATLGAAASLQFSLTERFVASSVALVTGCDADGPDGPPKADWEGLAWSADTLVIYMGRRHLQRIAQAPYKRRAPGQPAGGHRHASHLPRAGSGVDHTG